MTQTAPYFKVLFTRCDDDRTSRTTLNTLDAVDNHANAMGRQGWVLKEVNPVQHRAKVSWVGQTFREYSDNLPAKRGWFITCGCGEEDSTYDKQGAVEIAKDHSDEVLVIHKNGNAKLVTK